jgi:DNA-binding transcriptional MerR regulator
LEPPSLPDNLGVGARSRSRRPGVFFWSIVGDALEKPLTIRECAVATGVTPDTLRYYEKIGLLARVPRERNGHRRFGDDEVRWITFLRRLHATGMPIRHMQQYARLLRRGDETMAERGALLERHREELRARVEPLTENLRMIEKKIRHYETARVAADRPPHVRGLPAVRTPAPGAGERSRSSPAHRYRD